MLKNCRKDLSNSFQKLFLRIYKIQISITQNTIKIILLIRFIWSMSKNHTLSRVRSAIMSCQPSVFIYQPINSQQTVRQYSKIPNLNNESYNTVKQSQIVASYNRPASLKTQKNSKYANKFSFKKYIPPKIQSFINPEGDRLGSIKQINQFKNELSQRDKTINQYQINLVQRDKQLSQIRQISYSLLSSSQPLLSIDRTKQFNKLTQIYNISTESNRKKYPQLPLIRQNYLQHELYTEKTEIIRLKEVEQQIKQASLKSVPTNLDDLMLKIIDLNHKMQSLQKERFTLIEKCRYLQNINKALQQSLDTYSSQAQNQKQSIRASLELRQQVDTLQYNLKNTQKHLTLAQKQIATLKQQLHRTSLPPFQKIQNQQIQTNNLQNTTNFASTTQQINSLHQRLAIQGQQLKKANERIATLQNAIERSNFQEQQITSKLKLVQEQYNRNLSIITQKYQAQISNLQTKNKSTISIFNNQKEIRDLKQQIYQLTVTNQQLTTTIQILRTENQKLVSALIDLQGRLQQHTERSSYQNVLLALRQIQIHLAEANPREQLKQLQNSRIRLEKATEELQQLKKQNIALKAYLSSYQLPISQLQIANTTQKAINAPTNIQQQSIIKVQQIQSIHKSTTYKNLAYTQPTVENYYNQLDKAQCKYLKMQLENQKQIVQILNQPQ